MVTSASPGRALSIAWHCQWQCAQNTHGSAALCCGQAESHVQLRVRTNVLATGHCTTEHASKQALPAPRRENAEAFALLRK